MKTAGVVAAGHELTARAAETILRAGGNAVDAILAAGYAACVAEPVLAGMGGGGFLLVEPAEGKERLYDFFVHTPKVSRPEDELDFHPVRCDFGTAQQVFHVGLGAIATPGMIRGMFEIHRDLGSVPMREIVEPAVAIARDGVLLDALQAYIFSIVAGIYTHTPEARAIFGSREHDDGLVREGELLRQVELADTLEILAIEGDDLFYRGEMGRRLVEQCSGGGGCLTMDDLERYEVERRKPLSVSYRGARVSTNPPPSSGGLLIAFAMQLLEAVRMHEYLPGTAGHLGVVGHALEMTDKARIDAHLDETTAHPCEDFLSNPELLGRYREEILGRAEALRGTTHISAMDERGNVASLSLSNGEGCGHLLHGTGIMPNNMLGEEDLSPHGFHRWQTDQRMTSMMAPSTVRFPDGRTIATGSGGSKRIRSAIVQVLVNMIDFGMGVEEAVAAPRIFVEEGRLSAEGGFRETAIEPLAGTWPEPQVWDELNLYFGGVHTTMHGPKGFDGAGDPRRCGVCVVVD